MSLLNQYSWKKSQLLEQIRTIDKKRIDERLGCLSSDTMEKVNIAIKTSLDIK